MGCGTNIVPGFNESNKIKDPALEMKINQEFAQPSYQQQWNRDVNPKSNLKIPKKNRTRRKNVNTMTRRELIYHLGAMELPETNARDFNDSEIRDILVSQAPDMFFSSVKP